MARISKTPGVELYRFQNPEETIRLGFHSHGHVLKNERASTEDNWGGWKRTENRWMDGLHMIRSYKEQYLRMGWTIVKAFKG